MRRPDSRTVVVFVLLSAWWALPQESPTPGGDLTIQVQSQLVQLYVSVTEGNRRITDLAKSDFILTEDGSPRELHRLDSATVPLQVALLLDTSGSMMETLAATKEAAVAFVDSLNPEDRVSFIPFNSDIRVVPQLTDDRAAIVSAIRQAQARGGTKLYDALLFAMRHLVGTEGRKVIVVFSDGEDTARISSLETVLNAAARHGFPIYTIAARGALRTESLGRVLRQLAEINRGRMFVVDDPGNLRKTFVDVATELRSILVVNYYTDVPHDGRWHDVSLALTNPSWKVHSRKGFFARSGGAGGAAPESLDPAVPRSLPRAEPAVHDAIAQTAIRELMRSPAMDRALQVRPLALPLPSPSPTEQGGRAAPLFRVETRFVEIPVLVEAPPGREPPEMGERDFRIYEDDQLREIAFFSRDVGSRSLAEPRARAVSKLSARNGPPIAVATDSAALRLGRYYLVLDDMMTDSAAFLQIKKAAEKIVKDFQDPLRPLSLHLMSEVNAEIAPELPAEKMIEKIRRISPQGNPALTSNDGLISVYQAFLIDRGDREAQQVAELRYASSIGAQFANDMGQIDGQPGTPREVIETMVLNLARQLLMENLGQVSRALDGLRAIVNAASADAGSYPKDIIFISTGFTVGRTSARGDMSGRLGEIIAEARRGKTRFHTIDAAGLDVDEAIGLRANGSFLVRNPHLIAILQEHARAWRMDRQAPLSQLAVETGGRFMNSTNDLAGAADKLIGSRGRVYYLGFLSEQSTDGRFHPIRVTVSTPGALVHARKGYFAGRPSEPEAGDGATGATGESRAELLARAVAAQKAGDMQGFAAAVEPLAARYPGQADLWYNLGIAYFKLGNHQRAAEVLQRAFALAPDERAIGMLLSRALTAAGYRQAAAETLQIMARRQPQDVDLIIDLGRVYESDARVAEAYRLYRQVLDLTAVPPMEVYVLLARTSTRLGRHVEAGIFVNDFLSLGGSPAEIEPWRNRTTP